MVYSAKSKGLYGQLRAKGQEIREVHVKWSHGGGVSNGRGMRMLLD